MRRYYVLLTLVIMASLALALAQTPAKAPKPPAKAQASGAGGASALPTRATVASFLKHMFGFDPAVSWTITSIKTSAAPGIAEVTINLKSAQNNGERKLYVLPGRKHIIAGNMVPFPGESGAARPSDSAINSFVRQMTGGVNPSITWTIAEVKPHSISDLTEVTVVVSTPKGQGVQRFLVTADGKYALLGEPMPFGADPFAADRAKLEKGINGPTRGPANARVTIVEFADLQCPACRTANPIIQRLIADEPNARFVFQQFPLTQIHKWAFKAAQYGDCVYRENPAAFWKFLDAVYGVQEEITQSSGTSDDAGKKAEAKLTALASAAGVNGQNVAACANQPATAERVNQSVALAKELGVNATPTLFIGGRKVPSLSQIPYESLKRMVDYMISGK